MTYTLHIQDDEWHWTEQDRNYIYTEANKETKWDKGVTNEKPRKLTTRYVRLHVHYTTMVY